MKDCPLRSLEDAKPPEMKKLFAVVVLLLTAVTLYAQKDVTKFLGIPVDGSKSEMIRKLKEKGFRTDPFNEDVLRGEFNGEDSRIYIVENRGKVCRIMVADVNLRSEGNIRIRYNNLCHQFANNPNYLTFKDHTLPEDEDISYEMTVHDKQYQANYYQKTVLDTLAVREDFRSRLTAKYTEEQLADPTVEINADIVQMYFTYTAEIMLKKLVWFTIYQDRGKYSISIYYDNQYNRSNGEDL